MPDPESTEQGQGSKPYGQAHVVRFLTHRATVGAPIVTSLALTFPMAWRLVYQNANNIDTQHLKL